MRRPGPTPVALRCTRRSPTAPTRQSRNGYVEARIPRAQMGTILTISQSPNISKDRTWRSSLVITCHHLSSDQQLWILVNSQWPNLCRVEAEMPTSLRIGNQQGLRGKYPGSCCQSICIRALSLHIITFEN